MLIDMIFGKPFSFSWMTMKPIDLQVVSCGVVWIKIMVAGLTVGTPYSVNQAIIRAE
jgi:hypothetical protein